MKEKITQYSFKKLSRPEKFCPLFKNISGRLICFVRASSAILLISQTFHPYKREKEEN
jgi:hypothetical protein